VTTYGLCEQFFKRLCKNAQSELGEAFDIKEFHDICLRNGTFPLTIVSKEVEKYKKKG